MTRTLTGAEYLARALDSYDVSSVFFVPTILSRTLYEIERHTSISRVMTHGEKAAAYMADGYARASRGLGVCMAQMVGAANLAAGLRDPYLGGSPVLALTGGTYRHSYGRNFYQEIEDFPLFKPVTRFSERVYDVERLPDLLDQAVRAAIAGQPGPTHLELAGHAGDVLEKATFPSEPPAPARLSMPPHRPEPSNESVAEAIALLRTAERPVIVAGGGVRASRAEAVLRAFAERLGIPVATSLNAKAVLPADHPLSVGVPGLYARASANQVLLEADLAFYVGSRTGSQVTFNWQVPPTSTRVIQLDIEPEQLGRHYPHTVGLAGDALAGLTKLLAAMSGGPATDDTAGAPPDLSGWRDRVHEIAAAWRADVHPDRTSDAVPVRPERLCAELSAHLPSDALVVADTGHAGMWTGGMLDLQSPDQDYIRAAGSLGWGLPAAIGAQLADRSRPVVLFTGDGGLWYHLAELETAARWNVPVTIVVNNNRSLNQEINIYRDAYGGDLTGKHGELWHFTDVDFASIAESMHVRGYSVDKPGDIGSALDQAISTPGPSLVSVQTDMEIVAPTATTAPFAG